MRNSPLFQVASRSTTCSNRLCSTAGCCRNSSAALLVTAIRSRASVAGGSRAGLLARALLLLLANFPGLPVVGRGVDSPVQAVVVEHVKPRLEPLQFPLLPADFPLPRRPLRAVRRNQFRLQPGQHCRRDHELAQAISELLFESARPPLPAVRSTLGIVDENRITIEPGKRSGQPCIRGLRITVWDVLGWLAAGMSEEQIITDYPELEKDDFRAVFEYAARVGRRIVCETDPGREPVSPAG